MEEVEQKPVKKIKLSLKQLFMISIVLIALGGYGGAYYFYNQYRETKIVLDNPDMASKNEVKDITNKLSKIYALPDNEEPTVATVLEKDKIKDQPFFAKAENGDKVIIFAKSQLAILYRVNENRIINVAPVSLQQNDQTENNNTDDTTEVKPTTKPTQSPQEETTN